MDRKRKLLWRMWISAVIALVFAFPLITNSSWELGLMTSHMPWLAVFGWLMCLIVSGTVSLLSINSLVTLHEETKAAKQHADEN